MNIDELRAFLRGLSDRAISERLDLVQAQIPMAVREKRYDALVRLQEHERLLIAERARRFDDV